MPTGRSKTQLEKLQTHNGSIQVCHNYLVKNKLANLFLHLNDFFWKTFISLQSFFYGKHSKKNQDQCLFPQKILLANIAHIGDVIIATSIVKLIKSIKPDADIGFLIGTWAKSILQNNSKLQHIHYFDHWYLNRSNASLWTKIKRHFQTKKIALKEIKQIKYDVAVDLYAYFPNAIFLLWQSKIPVRVGYSSGGFGPLLTHQVIWQQLDQHIAYYHLKLLQQIFPDLSNNTKLKSEIFRDTNIDIAKILPNGVKAGSYVIFHPGSGSALKNWSLDRWIELKERLLREGNYLFFTGLGQNEEDMIDHIIISSPNCVNLCNKLSWQGLVEIIAQAKCLIAVDTSVLHVAAAFDVPCVGIYSGMSNYYQWQPLSTKSRVVTCKVACSPCYNGHGCEEMSCIKDISVDMVYDAYTCLCLK